MLLIGRFVRFLIAVVFFGLGYAVAQFANGNREVIAISIAPYGFQLPVYLLALVPLAAGLALGWLYTVPARTHEFAEHWRSWKTLRRVEKENRELRRSLDKVLDLPEEAAAATAAKALPRVEKPALPAPMEAEPVVVHEVKDIARPDLKKAARPAAKPARVKAARVRAHAPASNGRGHRPVPEPVPAS